MSDAAALERQLRERLKGVRLVGELDLDDGLHARLVDAVACHSRARLEGEMADLYPATLVCYLVAEGIRHYDGGFWNHLSEPLDASWAGPAFLRALERMGLALLEDETEGGFRYVSKVLLHGGVPQYCAADVLRLLARELTLSSADGAEIVGRWLRHPKLIEVLDKPARRFFEYGGAEAVALTDRLVEMFRRGSAGEILDQLDLGLPGYLVEEYKCLPLAERRAGRSLTRARPTVKFQERSGPLLVLPPTPKAEDASWLVIDGDRRTRRTASAHVHSVVPLLPYKKWIVELEDASRQSASTFGSANEALVWFFDGGSGVLLRQQVPLSSGLIVAVAPRRFQIRRDAADGGRLPEEHELPPLEGEWSRYGAHLLNLDGVSAIWLGDPDDIESTPMLVSVAPQPPRPRLVGTPLPRLALADGSPLYDHWPSIALDGDDAPAKRFRYRMREDGGRERTGSLSELLQVGGGYGLPKTEEALNSVVLDVVGPLGSDLRSQRFAVVQGGVIVDVPDRLLSPNEEATARIAYCEEIIAITIPPGCTAVPITLTDGDGSLPAQVRVDRLTWSIRRRNLAGPFGADQVTFGLEEFLDDEELAILVRTEVAASIRLLLLEGTSPLQELTDSVGNGSDVAVFPLRAFAETLRTSAGGALRLEVHADSLVGTVFGAAGRVLAPYEVGSVSVGLEPDPWRLKVEWEENRRYVGREVRLWSVERPWEASASFPIPDDVSGQITILLDDADPFLGRFIAEVAVSDEWAAPRRPRAGRAGVCFVDLGTTETKQGLLTRLGTSTSLEVMRSVMRSERRIEFSSDLLPDVVPLALQCLLSLTELSVPELLHGAGSVPLREVLFEEPELLARGLPQLVRQLNLGPADTRALSIFLLRDAIHLPAKHLCAFDRLCLIRQDLVISTAFDSLPSNDEEHREQWRSHLGWPQEGIGEPIPAGKPVSLALLRVTPDRLQGSLERLAENTAGTPKDSASPLTWGGHQRAMLLWLRDSHASGHQETLAWASRWAKLNDRSVRRLSEDHELQLKALQPPDLVRSEDRYKLAIARFPADLLAAAIHVCSFSPQVDGGTQALLEALPFAPDLVTRSCLVAIVLHKLVTFEEFACVPPSLTR